MVQIVDGEMRARAVCFCTDCRQRFFAAAHAGGPAVPADVVDCSAGIDLQLYVFMRGEAVCGGEAACVGVWRVCVCGGCICEVCV